MLSTFVHELMAAAEAGRDIVLVLGDDPGCSPVEAFASRFPRRFFKAGSGVQNLVGLAAGLASEGFQVFVHAGAEAALLRAAEQIHEGLSAHRLPVTLVADDAGQPPVAFHDYALLRLMPHLLIAAPGDCMEARACVRYLIEHPQPSCLFIGEAAGAERHGALPSVEPGRWLAVAEGCQEEGRTTLLSTGGALAAAMSLAASPQYRGCAVHTVPLWGMRQEDLQQEQMEAWDSVIVVEGQCQTGGFASWLLDSVAHRPDRLGRVRRYLPPAAAYGWQGRARFPGPGRP